MAKSGWYLEKKGKFYGPFSRAKIQQYFEAGKINAETRVAAQADGSDAKPFAAIDFDADTVAAPAPAKTPAAKPAKAAPSPSKPGKSAKAAKPSGPLPTHFFLEEADRGQGPFDLEQLGVLFKTGKVQGEVPVVYAAEGRRAQNVETLLTLFRKTQPAPKSDQVFLLQGSERIGPFRTEQVRAMQERGEIHAQTLIDVAAKQVVVMTAYQWVECVEEAAEAERQPAPKASEKATKTKKPPPKVRGREPRGVADLPVHKPAKSRVFSMLAVFVFAGLAVVGVYFGYRAAQRNRSPKPIPEEPKSLRELMRVRELPNFNALVLPIVRDALNIPLKRVKGRHLPEVPLLEKADKLAFPSYMEDRVQRETRYRIDGPYDVIYLSNRSGFVVGAAIEGPNFHAYFESQFNVSALAPEAIRLEGPGRIIWRAQAGGAVVIEVHWTKAEQGFRMAFILVKNATGL